MRLSDSKKKWNVLHCSLSRLWFHFCSECDISFNIPNYNIYSITMPGNKGRNREDHKNLDKVGRGDCVRYLRREDNQN